MNEVRRAAAVRSAEARRGQAGPWQIVQQGGPGMFQHVRLGAAPDFFERRGHPQIIQMPVRLSDGGQMMLQASVQAAGAKGAADVHVKARRKRETPQPPDIERRGPLQVQPQQIGAALAGDLEYHISNFNDINHSRICLRIRL